MLWRRKFILVGTVLAAVALVVPILLNTPSRYTAKALVLIDSRQRNIVDIESVITGLNPGESVINSEIEVLQSRTLIERLIESTELASDPEFNPALESTAATSSPLQLIRSVFGGDEEPQVALGPDEIRDRAVNRVLNALEINAAGESFIISLKFTAQRRDLSANVANALADLYILEQVEGKQAETNQATAWLTQRVEQLREEVRASEQQVEAFRASQGLIRGLSRGASPTLISQRISEMNSELVRARANLAEHEARLQHVQQLVDAGAVESAAAVVNADFVQSLKAQETEVARRYAELSSEYGERHPLIINLRAELGDLTSRVSAEMNGIVETMRAETRVARARVAAIDGDYRTLEEQVGEADSADVELRSLEREAAANRQLLETFLVRLKETKDQAGLQQADARVVSYVARPTSPSGPQRKLILAFSVVLSGILGLAIAAILEILESGLRSADEIETQLGVPSLGLVPYLRGKTFRKAEPEAFVLEHPRSAFSDSLRNLRTNLRLGRNSTESRTVLVTSSVPGEGKTSIAVSLARLTSTMGENVLLIDCDNRRPRIESVFGLQRSPGFVEYLEGSAELWDILHKDERTGLTVVPSGRTISNSTHLLQSEGVRYLFSQLRERYDLVLIDSPPILSMPDAKILAGLCDLTVFVAKWRATRQAVVGHGVRQLLDAGGSLAGVALSQVDVRKHALYGFSDSGYYYGKYNSYYSD